jgi:uncharacterized repeat protein (TIGR01451 family)
VAVLPPSVATTTFTVSWTGQDSWTGIAAYDVQVRDGYEGAWTGWLSGTVAPAAVWSGAHGHTWFFRARACDGAGNWGTFTDEEWGQAFTTVLTEPAAVLATSRKTVTPRLAPPDGVIRYTVLVSNTGSLTATVTLTDALPGGLLLLTETLSATVGPPPVYAAGAVLWDGAVAPGGEVGLSYALSPTAGAPLLTPLTNTVEIAGGLLGPVVRRAGVVRGYLIQLPLVMRGG